MMSFVLKAVFDCFPQSAIDNSTEKPLIASSERDPASKSDHHDVESFLKILFSADKNDPNLKTNLNSAISATSWKENIAERILNGIQNALEKGTPMGEAMSDAVTKSVDEAFEFAKEHPLYFVVIALGVLVLLAPWVLEVLGFAELSPVEGSFAAIWQARYAGYVPKGSLFSFFQRLGMIWK